MRTPNFLILPIIFLISLGITQVTFAGPSGTSEVSCGTYGSDAVSCNQCFDGGTDYVGDAIAKAFDDTFINNSATDDFLIRRSSGLSGGPVPLQPQVTVGVSSDYGVSFPASIPWLTFMGDDAFVFLAGTSNQIARMNGGVLFTAVTSGANPNKPALRYEYIVNVQKYDFMTSTTSGPVINHKECAFVAPRWCGDGIKSNGEICDDGAQNGQAGKCNSVCTDTVEPIVSCDSLSVSTTSGNAPLAVVVSCNATNASSYRIDCGNGTTNLSSSTTCNYNAGGTFSPTCTINGSVTSPACTKNITVGTPPPTPRCSTTLSGSVDFPLASNTPNLCSIGNPVDFAANIIQATTYYTWRCSNAVGDFSPTCRADYDVPPLPADLALKKYVNSEDAQTNATAVELANNANFVYTVTVQNVGTGPLVASLTTVSDPLPAGVTLRSTPSGAGWSCTGNAGAVSWSCTRNDGLAAGSFFPTITVSVTVNSSPTYLPNTATVTNPNDTVTSNNTDPAVIHISSTPPPACVPGTRTGPQAAPLTAASTNLCPAAQVVGGFTATTVGTTTNYTWSCNGSAVGGACAASYTTSLPACVPGTRTGPQAAPLTTASTNLCPAGQAVGGFTATTVGTTTNYTWSCNGSAVGGACAASYTTSLPACVPGTRTGPQAAPVTAASPGLCPAGQAVGGFTATTVGTTTNYTWSCNGSAVGGACAASYTTSLPACVPGTRTGPQAAPVTAASPGLCPAGQAVGGFTATTVGTTTNYTWSCNGSAVGGACAASYDSATTPSCNSILATPTTGNIPLSSTIACFTSNATTVSISCGNGQTINDGYGVCNYTTVGTYTPRCTVNGTISPASCAGSVTATNTFACVPGTLTGPQAAPVTAASPGLCPAGQAVGGFTATTVGTTTNYTWSCNGSAVGGACAASYTNTTPSCNSITTTPSTGNIPLTSSISCNTSNATTVAISCGNGQSFTGSSASCVFTSTGTYTPRCTVNGTISPASCAGSVTATNTFACVPGTLTGPQAAPVTAASPGLCPAGQAVGGFTATTVGTTTNYTWSCNGSAVGGACAASYTSTLPACVPGTLTGPQAAPVTAASPGLCPAGQAVGGFTATTVGTTTNYTWSCNGSAVGGACAASYTTPTTSSGVFNLSVKKYIGTNDAQTPATAVSVTQGAILTYQLVVRNSGTGGSNTGTTTLQDILPSGVEFNGTTPWTNGNWNCNYTSTGRTIVCTNSVDRVASGANLGSTIFVPFRVTASTSQTILNITAIDNPSETLRCTATGTLPTTDTGVCTLDVTNSNPAYFTVGGGGGGGVAVVGKICISGVASCANYNSIIACNAAGAVGCRDADIPGQLACQNQYLDCSGGGGGGGCVGSCGGCGDGVLQGDEECDVVGAPWCQSCRVSCLNNAGNCTNPGANPIMDIWMTIPRLTHARLGYSWLDGVPGKIPFEENRMILGVGTKAFTLADTVGFGIRTRYAIPLMIEADKRICLKSSGTALNGETICTTFGDAATLDSTVVTWTRPLDGKQYVLLGKGDFQYQLVRTGPYYVQSTSGPNDIDLFKGSRLYRAFGGGTPTLNSAFFGTRVGDAAFTLATDTVNLVSLPVRVSAALVGTTATPVNRSIENFISQTSLHAFLSSIRSPSSVSSTTTTRNDSSSNANINLNIRATGDKTVSNMSQLLAYAYNGNQNIIAIKGNLTLENCSSNTFVMEGVRSVIVEGNLILKCNTVYPSSDTTSSWAWIVKGGNILVDGGVPTEPQSGVSKLTGVYVTVPEIGFGGEFRSIGGLTSQHILRVDGSFYGNAKPLLDSRLYARGTSAYEILTTGTILSYSNRALVNPPPLLSEYLRNYSVERVVR